MNDRMDYSETQESTAMGHIASQGTSDDKAPGRNSVNHKRVVTTETKSLADLAIPSMQSPECMPNTNAGNNEENSRLLANIVLKQANANPMTKSHTFTSFENLQQKGKEGQKVTLAERRANSIFKTKQLSVPASNPNTQLSSLSCPVLQPPKLSLNTGLRSSEPVLQRSKSAKRSSPEQTQPLSAISTVAGMSANRSLPPLLEISLGLEAAGYLPPWLAVKALTANSKTIAHQMKAVFRTISDVEDARLTSASHRFTREHANARKNQYLNRYVDIVPFDYNRVQLQINSDDAMMTDYINASHLHLEGVSAYIATQGPLPASFGAFWKMVYECKSPLIVMLTTEEEGGRIKCHRYWPDVNAPLKRYATSEVQGSACFQVQLASQTPIMNGEAIQREFVIQKQILSEAVRSPDGAVTSLATPMLTESSSHRATMIQYLAWPDRQVSEVRSLLTLLDICNHIHLERQRDAVVNGGLSNMVGPMVVHCSAGCGRTGVFCVVDSVLKLLQTSNAPVLLNPNDAQDKLELNAFPKGDLVAAVVNHFRKQRYRLVQSLEQYIFCYESIITRINDWFTAGIPATWNKTSN